MIVTSRDHLRGLVALDGAAPVPPAPLDAGPSHAILGTERVAGEADAVADVIAQCARLPLALRIAAANLRANPYLPIAEYAASHHALGDATRARTESAAAVDGLTATAAADLAEATAPARS
ncbi:hypothetical protein ABT369_04805 [Dactylosporangium sp. NPDC000244]|uniref:hypothetical protein n=1 Tax=Dactylosporangium sp. NPDC000244 TaxID=3154365 RepID=UPI00332E3B5D